MAGTNSLLFLFDLSLMEPTFEISETLDNVSRYPQGIYDAKHVVTSSLSVQY